MRAMVSFPLSALCHGRIAAEQAPAFAVLRIASEGYVPPPPLVCICQCFPNGEWTPPPPWQTSGPAGGLCGEEIRDESHEFLRAIEPH